MYIRIPVSLYFRDCNSLAEIHGYDGEGYDGDRRKYL